MMLDTPLFNGVMLAINAICFMFWVTNGDKSPFMITLTAVLCVFYIFQLATV